MSSDLSLHEELLLLVLDDDTGRARGSGFDTYAIAGGLVAELALRDRITIDLGRRRPIAIPASTSSTGDELLDACLATIANKKPRTVERWVGSFAGMSRLRHRVAARLCDLGVLRADEEKVLFFFTRRIYPETSLSPEREIVERLRLAIFGDGTTTSRTALLAALANTVSLLDPVFGKRELRARRARLESLRIADPVAQATHDAIAAAVTAATTAAIVAATTAATVSS